MASLSHGNANALATASKFIITNKGATDAVFTVNGSTSPANPFTGAISDGATNKVTVVKGGTGTLTLNGTTTFSTLNVTGGTLNLNAALTTSAGGDEGIAPAFGDFATSPAAPVPEPTAGMLLLGGLRRPRF